MLKFLVRHRRRIAFGALLLLSAILLSLRAVHRRTPGAARAARTVQSIFVPLSNGLQQAFRLPESLLRAFDEMRRMREENERLRSSLQDLQREVHRLQSLESDQSQLQAFMKLRPPGGRNVRPARVVAQDPSTWNDTFLINLGRENGLAPGSPVVSPQGVVGRVTDVFPRRSRVLLAVAANSNVAVLDVRSRVRGVAVGTGTPRMRLDFIPASADVQSGDTLVSSGLGGVFPRGYPVGTVVKRSLDPNRLTLDVELAPSVDFGSVEYLYVLDPEEDLP